jgi:hypothetical protein
VDGLWLGGVLLLALGVYTGVRSQQARQIFSDYRAYLARAAALRWLRWRLFGVALWGWALIALAVTGLLSEGE